MSYLGKYRMLFWMIPFTGSWVPMTNLFSKHQNPDNLAFHPFLFTRDETILLPFVWRDESRWPSVPLIRSCEPMFELQAP